MKKSFPFFGPGRDLIWEKISKEIQAEYVKDGFWSGSKVVAKYENRVITLDVFYVPQGKAMFPITRMRAPFKSTRGFRFAAYNQGLLQEIGKLFGMQDIQSGDKDFDKQFILKGNDEAKVKKLFSSAKIRELISQQGQIHLELRDDEGWFGPDFPEDTDELYCHIAGELRHEEKLKNLFYLFSEVLSELELNGEADSANPGIELK